MKVMKKILLSKGKFAKVDDEDFDKLNELKWHVGSREKEKYTYFFHMHLHTY